MSGKARVGFKRSMNRVVREVEVEGLTGSCDLRNVLLRLYRQRFGQKCLRAVIRLQMRHGIVSTPGTVAVTLLAIVASGSTERRTRNIDVKAQISRLGTFMPLWAEVCFANMDSLVAVLSENTRQAVL